MKTIDFDKGWKFKEEDKQFILNYFKQAIEVYKEYDEIDRVIEYQDLYNRLLDGSVKSLKKEIQEEAFELSECVHHEIYEYYDKETLKFIENAIVYDTGILLK